MDRYAQGCQLGDHELHLQLPAVLVPAVAHLPVLGLRAVQDNGGAVEIDVVVVDHEPLSDPFPQLRDDPFAVLPQYDDGPVERPLRDLVLGRESELSSDGGILQPFRTGVHGVGDVHGVRAEGHDDEIEPDALGLQTADIAQNAHEFEIMAYRTDEAERNR